VSLFLILAPFAYYVHVVYTKNLANCPDHYLDQHPRYFDFIYCCGVAAIVGVLQKISALYGGRLFRSICKDQDNAEKLALHEEKAGKYLFRVLYIFAINVFSY